MSTFSLRQYTKINITASIFALIALIFGIMAIVFYNTTKVGDQGTWNIFIACISIFAVAYGIQLIYSIVVCVLNRTNVENYIQFFRFYNIFNMIPVLNAISFFFGFMFLSRTKF